MRKYIIFVFLFVFVLSANTAFAQQDDDVDVRTLRPSIDGNWSPNAESRTAMRRSVSSSRVDAFEEKLFDKYTEEVTLTESLKVKSMKFWDQANRKVGTTDETCKARNSVGECTRKEKISIRPGTKVRFDPNDMSKGVVEGCLNEFSISFEYEIEVTKTVAKVTKTETRVPMCANVDITIVQARRLGYTITDDGRCILPQADEEDCPECPPDAKLERKTSKMTRFVKGGWVNTGISTAGGIVGAGIINGNLKDGVVYGGIPSFIAGRGAQAANPSPDSVKATCGGKTKTFKKGDDGKVGDCKLVWEDDVAILKYEDLDCKTMPLNKNFNLTIVALPSKGGNSNKGVKTQNQTGNPRTGTSGNGRINIPGGGTAPTGPTTPTRPTRQNTPGTGNALTNSGSGNTRVKRVM